MSDSTIASDSTEFTRRYFDFTFLNTGYGSSVGCASALYAAGRGFDPHVRQHSFVHIGREIISSALISTAILSLPLIQEGQFSVTGKRMRSKYW